MPTESLHPNLSKLQQTFEGLSPEVKRIHSAYQALGDFVLYKSLEITRQKLLSEQRQTIDPLLRMIWYGQDRLEDIAQRESDLRIIENRIAMLGLQMVQPRHVSDEITYFQAIKNLHDAFHQLSDLEWYKKINDFTATRGRLNAESWEYLDRDAQEAALNTIVHHFDLQFFLNNQPEATFADTTDLIGSYVIRQPGDQNVDATESSVE